MKTMIKKMTIIIISNNERDNDNTSKNNKIIMIIGETSVLPHLRSGTKICEIKYAFQSLMFYYRNNNP